MNDRFGDGPRHHDNAADDAWLRETAAAGQADQPAHRAIVLWVSAKGQMDRFQVWCVVCGWLDDGSLSKGIEQAKAETHEWMRP